MMGLWSEESGQATVEYALVMVAAGAIALTLIVWATTTGTLPAFFDAVMARISDSAATS